MEMQEIDLHLILLGLLASIFVYSMLTNAIAKTILTLPILFTGVGFLLSEPLISLGDPEMLETGIRMLAEVTLVLILFSDASHVRFKSLRQSAKLPIRMLLVGLPLTLIVGTVVTYAITPEGGIAMALLTAAVLSPTDAAIAQSVVSNDAVPENLRQTINVESGLNDGLVLPFVLLGAILTAAGMRTVESEGLASAALLQIVLGPVVGAAVGWAAARVMDYAIRRALVAEASGGVAFLSVAAMSYLMSETVGGNGFIAAFVAGMVFGNTYRHDITFISEFMEGVGQLLTIFAFLAFGALLLPAGLEHLDSSSVALAVLFLTVVRMGPIWLSLLGTGLHLREKLFLGWFGPRGIASILFTLIVLEEFEIPGREELLACVSLTVFLSILFHGISASPLARLIGTGRDGT